MKKTLFFAIVMAFVFTSIAQTVTYDDILAQKSALELTGKKAGDNITKYVASNGETYTIGSTITYGIPTNGKYYVYFMDVTGSWLNVLGEDENASSSERAQNQERAERVANRNGGIATIKKIQCLPIDMANKKTSGCKIYLVLNRGGIACTNFEEALQTGEVRTPISAETMASEAAIQELKKWKEKLDLQIITQEEYDAKKAELMKYIK